MSTTTVIVGSSEKSGAVCAADILCSDGLNALVVVDAELYSIAKGKRFAAYTELTIAAGGAASILGIVGAANIIMAARGIDISTASTAGIELKTNLYEDVTCATSVSNVDVFSVNRQLNFLDNNSYFEINDNPATITGGILLKFRSGYVNTEKKAYERGLSTTSPYVMRANTKYELRITNLGDSPVVVKINWEWIDGTPL